MGYEVFISHSSKDKAIADQVCAALEANGMTCWIAPRDILPGMDWSEAIVRGLSECPVTVLVFSGAANDSVQVRREVQRAFEKGKAVVPFRIENVTPTDAMEYYLSSIHWLNALTPPLEPMLETLVQTVRRLLPAPTENPSPVTPSIQPPQTTIAAPPASTGNLPAAASPYIGREAELDAWEALLLQPTTRVLTLVGFGGMGKTRSALELATRCTAHFPQGAWWLELEEAQTAEEMQQRIALGLGLTPQPPTPIKDVLIAYLRDKNMLLTLDNTEQIPEAGKAVAALTQAAPQVRWLVTSRRALEIAAEQVVEIPPLHQEEAEALFLDRAKSRQAGFERTDANGADITEICRRLEGMPLALELAASRIVGMTPRDILGRLNEWFRLLQSRAPHLPPRQRALNGAIEWSHELLTEEDKELFAQLAVFVRGFTLDAAEQVCDSFDVFEGVQELRKHSFLRAETHAATQQMRFLMLELVREYAEQKLSDAEIRRRHAEFFLKFAEDRVRKLRTQEEAVALEELGAESDNLRSALFWAESAKECSLCARLAHALFEPLYKLGLWSDAERCLEAGYAASAQLEGAEREHRAALGNDIAGLALDRGDSDKARAAAEESLQLYRELEYKAGQARSLNLLALATRDAGDPVKAQAMFEEALTLCAQDDHHGRAMALHNLARLATARDNLEEAQQLYAQSLTHRRTLGDRRGEAEVLLNLGALAYLADNRDEARRCYEESLTIRRSLRDRLGIGILLYNLGEAAEAEDELPRAVTLFLHAERILHELQWVHASAPTEALAQLAARMEETDYQAARQEALQSGWEVLF